MLLLVMAGCGSPLKALQAEMGPDTTPIVQMKFDGGVALLGTRPSGEWVVGASRGGQPEWKLLTPPAEPGRPVTEVVAGTAIVAAKAPAGADRWELLNDNQKVLKGKVEKGIVFIAWPTGSDKPAFILRILDAKGAEIYRWPPPGGLPAA